MGKKKPDNLVLEQRFHNIRLSVWENVDKDGKPYHNVTIVRRYESEPGEWSSSSSFTGLGDLALVRQAVNLAINWLQDRAMGTPSDGQEEQNAQNQEVV